MLYIRMCFDKPGLSSVRESFRAAHRAYVHSGVIRTVQAGPLCADDADGTNIGSFFIVEADNQEQVVEFHKNDPLTKADLYGEVRVHRWDKHIG